MTVKRTTAQRLNTWLALAGQTRAAVRATARALIATTLPSCIARFATADASTAAMPATGAREALPLPLPLPLALPGSPSRGVQGSKTARPASASPTPLHLPHPAAVDEAEPAASIAAEATLAAVDFLAQVDASLRFCYVSARSIEFLGYHPGYLGSLPLH